MYRSASHLLDSFLTIYSCDSKEGVLHYIYKGQSDVVDWSLLNGISRDVVSYYKLSYDGDDLIQRDLFNLLVETVDDQTLNFKMIYADEKWWIYDFYNLEISQNSFYIPDIEILTIFRRLSQ